MAANSFEPNLPIKYASTNWNINVISMPKAAGAAMANNELLTGFSKSVLSMAKFSYYTVILLQQGNGRFDIRMNLSVC